MKIIVIIITCGFRTYLLALQVFSHIVSLRSSAWLSLPLCICLPSEVYSAILRIRMVESGGQEFFHSAVQRLNSPPVSFITMVSIMILHCFGHWMVVRTHDLWPDLECRGGGWGVVPHIHFGGQWRAFLLLCNLPASTASIWSDCNLLSWLWHVLRQHRLVLV